MTTSNESEKNEFSQVESSRAATSDGHEEKPRRRGCVGFLKKWWWLLLIILIIVILVVILPLMLVAVPHIIQGKIDDATLSIEGIHFTQTQTTAGHISINSTIRTSSSQSATIEGFNASLYLEDKLPHTPFLYLQMPETSSQSVQTVNISQEMNIYNAQAFADYNTWYLLNQTFRMTVDGYTYVHVSGLKKAKVHFKKTVTVTGVNGFDGSNVTSATVSLAADAQGDNFHGYITIPNPSVLTFEAGNVTYDTLLNGSSIGTSYFDNLIIYPGNNNVSFRANISQTPILAAVTSQPYCDSGILPTQFRGKNVVNNGQVLPYFVAALSQKLQSVPINAGAAISALLGQTVKCSS